VPIKMGIHKWRFFLAMFGLWIMLTSYLEFCFIFVKPLGIDCENYYMFIMWGNLQLCWWGCFDKEVATMGVFSCLRNYLHICEGYVLYCFSGKLFQMYWDINHKCNCHRWSLNFIIGNRRDLIHDDL
jgi:hypothetical protein